MKEKVKDIGKARNATSSFMDWKERMIAMVSVLVLSAVLITGPSALYVQSVREEIRRETKINNRIKQTSELNRVRKDLITFGDTNQDRVLDLYETRGLLDKLGYDGMVEPGTRISVYSPDSGEGAVYCSGDFVYVPLDRAKSVLEEN